MDDLNRELEALLRAGGADLVGSADPGDVPEAGLPMGVLVAVRLPPEIVRSIAGGPSHAYYEAYRDINARLDRIVTAGAAPKMGTRRPAGPGRSGPAGGGNELRRRPTARPTSGASRRGPRGTAAA